MIKTNFVDTVALEKYFVEFSKFVEGKGFEKFEGFSNRYIVQEEGYKKNVWYEAREALAFRHWKKNSIGTGAIWKCILLALSKNENVVDYRDVNKMKSQKPTEQIEGLFYDLIKKMGDEKGVAFEKLLNIKGQGLTQRLLSFLLFLVDDEQYVPLAPEVFDVVFEIIGVQDFKTSNNASWDNYKKFIQIINEVRCFLKERLRKEVSLLDAHSFLWRLTRDVINNKSEIDKDESAPTVLFEKPQLIEEETGVQLVSETLQFKISEEFDELAFPEGKEIYVLHKKRERSKDVVQLAKERALSLDSNLPCRICGFSFFKVYGELGIGFIEAHHIRPLSELKGESEIGVKDLILVCSNCHRMLHRRRPWITHENLEEIIKSLNA